MPTFHALLTVALAGLALSATPGPSMLYVLSQTVGHSRSAGFASAVGLCLGGVLLAIATAFGLAAVFARFDWLVTLLRYLGAAYLVWLGCRMILSARESARTDLSAQKVGKKPVLSILWQGVLVELLNPKTVLFFALFLPQFVVFDQSHTDTFGVTLQLLVLGCMVPLTALPSDIFVAFLGSILSNTLNANQWARATLSCAGGVLLVGIAVGMHWQTLWA